MTRIIVRRVMAITAIAIAIIGIPAFLVSAASVPLPPLGEALSNGPFSDTTFVTKSLALACWLMWLDLMVCLAVELWAQLRQSEAPSVSIGGPLQWFAAWLIAAALVAPMRPNAGTLMDTRTPLAVLLASQEVALAEGTIQPIPQESTHVEAVPALQHDILRITVKPRDSLCALAKKYLGDEMRFREIFELNRGRPQPDGGALIDPALIRPGWILEIPVDSTIEPTAQDVTPDAQASTSQASAPTTTTTVVPSVPDIGAIEDAPSAAVELPSGSVVALSFASGIATAVGLNRLLRRRHYRPSTPSSGLRREASDLQENIDRLVRATESDEALESESPPPLRPGQIEIGVDGTSPVVVDLLDHDGIGVDGVSTDDVARAVIAGIVARSSTEMVAALPVNLMERLVPGVDAFPGLDVVRDEREQISRLEADLIARSRLLDSEDADDIRDHWSRDPGDPLPVLVAVVGGLTADQRRRVATVSSLGRRLGVTVISFDGVLDDDMAHIAVDSDNCIASVSDALRSTVPVGSSLFRLTAHDAKDALVAIASSRVVMDLRETPDTVESPDATFDVPNTVAATPVFVSAFGGFDVEVDGKRIDRSGRKKSWEVLTFFLLHPEGASLADAAMQMWPTATPEQREGWFWSALGPLRTRMREETGMPELKLIDLDGDVYRIDTHIIDCDLWEFQRALRAVEKAEPGSAARSEALRHACNIYTGDLFKQTTYGWIQAARADARRRFLDAVIELAENQEDAGDLDGAVVLLDRGIERDPVAEELYRRVIDLRGEQGRPDAAREVYSRLEACLAEISAEPDALTERALLRATERDSGTRD